MPLEPTDASEGVGSRLIAPGFARRRNRRGVRGVGATPPRLLLVAIPASSCSSFQLGVAATGLHLGAPVARTSTAARRVATAAAPTRPARSTRPSCPTGASTRRHASGPRGTRALHRGTPRRCAAAATHVQAALVAALDAASATSTDPSLVASVATASPPTYASSTSGTW